MSGWTAEIIRLYNEIGDLQVQVVLHQRTVKYYKSKVVNDELKRAELESELKEQKRKLKLETKMRSRLEQQVNGLKSELVRMGCQPQTIEGCSEGGDQEEMELDSEDEDGGTDVIQKMECGCDPRSSPHEPVVETPVNEKHKSEVNIAPKPKAIPLVSIDGKEHGRCHPSGSQRRKQTKGPTKHNCLCGYSSKWIFGLKHHIITSVYGNVFKCEEPNCGEAFGRVIHLKDHALTAHNLNYLTDYGCPMCGILFEEVGELQGHLETCPEIKKVDAAMI